MSEYRQRPDAQALIDISMLARVLVCDYLNCLRKTQPRKRLARHNSVFVPLVLCDYRSTAQVIIRPSVYLGLPSNMKRAAATTKTVYEDMFTECVRACVLY